MNPYINFNEFLSNIPSEKTFKEIKFNGKEFARRKLNKIDIEFKVFNSNNYYHLACKMPYTLKWKNIHYGFTKEGLLRSVYENGLKKMNQYLDEDYIIYQINNNISQSINDSEKWMGTSIYEPLSFIKIGTYKKECIEVSSRGVGKDCRLTSYGFIKYCFLINNDIINDEYLNKFLPPQREFKEIDYGYISSGGKSINETVEINKKLPERLLKNYNRDEHRKILNNKNK